MFLPEEALDFFTSGKLAVSLINSFEYNMVSKLIWIIILVSKVLTQLSKSNFVCAYPNPQSFQSIFLANQDKFQSVQASAPISSDLRRFPEFHFVSFTTSVSVVNTSNDTISFLYLTMYCFAFCYFSTHSLRRSGHRRLSGAKSRERSCHRCASEALIAYHFSVALTLHRV